MEALFNDLLRDYSDSKLYQVILQVKSEPDPLLSPSSLKLLKKLWFNTPINQQFDICSLYIHLLKLSSLFPLPLLIQLANDSLQLSGQLRGSEISDIIDNRVFKSFTKLKKTQTLARNESYSIDQLLEKYKDESVHSRILSISERIRKNDHSAMQDLTNLLYSFSSTRKLFNCIENDIEDLVNSFKSVKSLQIFVQILNFLNTFLIDRFYLIDNKKYSPSYLKYYQVHSKVFKVLWKVVLNFSKADIVISQNLIKVIPKFWNLFLQQRGKMLPDIVMLLKEIFKARSAESCFLSEKFLYEVFTDDEVDSGIKSYLKSELSDLFLAKGFNHQLQSSTFIESLKISQGFPLLSHIEPGDKLILKYQVQFQSLFYFTFVLDSHDIDYSIILHSSDCQTTLLSVKHLSSPHPAEHKLIIQSKGAITVEFNNSYSWLNSKSIRYKILILNPVNASYHQDTDPVCAVLDEDHLVLFCKDKRIEHFSPEDPHRTILNYMRKHNKKSINLVSSYEFNPQFEEFNEILWASDIETASKFVWQKMKIDMIIVASNIPLPRFTLMVKGKTVRTASGKGIAEGLEGMVSALVKVFKAKVVLFRVDNLEECTSRLRETGLEVELLEIEVEELAFNLKSILCSS